MSKKDPRPNVEVADLVAASGLTHPQVAAALGRTLGRAVQPYVIGRMISGLRSIKADEMDALRHLATADPIVKIPTQSFASQLTERAEFVPLYSARTGNVLTVGEDNRVGLSPIHPSQRGFRSAFNFIQPDERLGDLIRRGYVAHAVRDLPPLPGMPVLVERKSGEAYARIYVREDANTVFLKVLRPKEQDEQLARTEVTGLHRITGVTFGGA